MDTTLVMVTLLSMGMAAALSVIVWRMLRDERQRSEARVAALAGMTARPAARRQMDPLDLPIRPTAPPARIQQPIEHRIERPVAAAPVGSLFVEPAEASPWGHRFAVMAGLGLVIASGVLFALASSDSGVATKPAATVPAAQPAATAPGAGLELVSMRDSRTADALTITGLVRNPQGGGTLTRVAVTAYTFDDKGAFLASGRALIDVTSLAPSDESPFVVTVPVSDAVARYRIGFRGEDGRVIAHVDRRQ
jgi:hypothetical protein